MSRSVWLLKIATKLLLGIGCLFLTSQAEVQDLPLADHEGEAIPSELELNIKPPTSTPYDHYEAVGQIGYIVYAKIARNPKETVGRETPRMSFAITSSDIERASCHAFRDYFAKTKADNPVICLNETGESVESFRRRPPPYTLLEVEFYLSVSGYQTSIKETRSDVKTGISHNRGARITGVVEANTVKVYSQLVAGSLTSALDMFISGYRAPYNDIEDF